MEIEKITHIELSDGETNIVSNKNCPLNITKDNISDFNNIIEIDSKLIPTCNCRAYVSESVNKYCPYYYGVIYSEEKGLVFDCRYTK